MMARDKDMVTCGICKASFSCDSFTRFMEHKLLHVDANQRVNCFLCLKWFPKRNALLLHLERVHAIPQRSTACDRDLSSNPIALSSSARCNPFHVLNSTETEQNPSTNNGQLYDNCFSFSTTTQLDLPRSDVPLSLQQRQRQDDTQMDDDIILQGTESSENSNLSVDVLTTGEDPVIEFPLSTLNYYEDVCSNRLLISDDMTVELESETTFSSSSITLPTDKNESSELTSVNQKSNKELPLALVGDMSSTGKSGHPITLESEIFPVSSSYIASEGRKMEGKIDNQRQGQKPEASKEKENIDFHFLLGTTSISGSSMKYERVEFRCMHCSFSSAWRPSLLKHMKIAHSDVLAFHEILNIQSAALSKPSSNQSELAKKYKIMKLSEHSKMNLQNKVRKVKRLARAVEYQDIPGKYACPVCNKVFSRIRYIRRHQMTHKTQRSYLCDHCGKSFKTRSTLVAHTQSHNTKLYQCPQCDFVSNLTRAIHCHRQLHPNGSVVCEICGAVYTDKSTLKKHMRVHDPSRPFSCTQPNCTWRFKTENLMKAHVKSHTTEGKFLCAYCGFRFRHKYHLQRHISRIHSQEILMESSTNVKLNPSPTTPVLEPPISDSAVSLSSSNLTDFSQRQEISLNLNNNPSGNQVILKTLLNSSSGISLEPGHQIEHQSHSQTFPCVQNGVPASERTTGFDNNQIDQQRQNVVQVLSLMNNNGQEIVISLPADTPLDLLNNSIVNLDVSYDAA